MSTFTANPEAPNVIIKNVTFSNFEIYIPDEVYTIKKLNETTDVNPGQLPTPTPSPTHTITPTEDIVISEILSVDSCIQISGDESGGYEWSGHTFYNGEIHQIIRRTTDGFYIQV